ncbi:glycosyltransferase family 2 protein [Pyxidicoccus sp. MSG2]|uniref:glycosyltransferase family 2 protein n=1 Tax=Pyxidicoccus sp. MSG2 TaxID=2996790 RepID=UPI00226E52C7|nr:glycosyltransferase family 2 protein [Pyxidicoccus sp. MSG2]MCY1022007.1 glycosyltransferase family 2 protein [Pyxidicoccus sp. MSG2]
MLWVGVVLYENAPRELERLCASFALNRETADFHVVWRDNSPTDALRTEVERLWPGADYRFSGANLGFGAAHNRGMAEAFAAPAPCAYVCVNPDGVLHPRCLTELLAQVAAVGARAGLVEARLFPDEHPKPYAPRTHETPWCSGCVLLVTRGLYAAVGGFDENFFMYCEDVDLSWRARAAGFGVHVAPRALVHHYTVDRAITPRRERMVRRSAAYLGHKYGNAAFARERLREYHALGGEPFELPQVQRPSSALRDASDFEHLLQFAEPRW